MKITYRGFSNTLAKFFGVETPLIKKEEINKKNMRVGMSGYKGVSKASRTNKWEAYLAIPNGNKTVKMHIGTFPTVTEAHTARLNYIDRLK